VGAVILRQVRQGARIREIVDGNNLQIRQIVTLMQCTQNAAPYSTISVDCQPEWL
jgi:hypothetical protein